jgi:type VI secretion system secreted protein Hcp
MSIEGIFACLLRYFTAVVSIALVLAVPTTATADLITLKLPGITGDVTVEGQQGTIEVLSLSGNVQEPVTGSAGGSRARSLPVFSDLMIHKRLDRSSPALFLALVKGSLLGSGVITFLRTDQGGFTTFFTITLTNVLLTKFQTGDSENEVLAGREQINLNYERIELRDEVTGQSACWNIPAATAC